MNLNQIKELLREGENLNGKFMMQRGRFVGPGSQKSSQKSSEIMRVAWKLSMDNILNLRQFYLVFSSDEKSYTLCSQFTGNRTAHG